MARHKTLVERPKAPPPPPAQAGDKRAAETLLEPTPSKRSQPSPTPAAANKPARGRPSKAAAKTATAAKLRLSPPTERLDVFVFGDGSMGELGLGDKKATGVKAPRLNTNLDAGSVGVVDMDTGGMHCVALTHDNKILTWGVNDEGALGRDTTWEGGLRDADADDKSDASSDSDEDVELNPYESTPTAVPAEDLPEGAKFVQVVAGDSATFALTDDGRIYVWGTFRDPNGEKALYYQPDGTLLERTLKPMQVPALQNIVSISAGSNFCLALDSSGNVYTWGYGDQNQLGRRLVPRRRHEALHPSHVALPKKKVVSIHACDNHAFAIDSDGNTWAWGLNNFAQCGINTGAGEDSSTIIIPTKVKSLAGKNMKMIQGGSHHSIGITHEGECLVWGRMDGGQSGLDPATLPVDDPSKIALDARGKPRIILQPMTVPVTGCTDVAAGPEHNLVITSEGKAYSWGFNASYQCGQPSGDDVPVATLMNGKQIRDRKVCWAGAGGQYGVVAGLHLPANGTAA